MHFFRRKFKKNQNNKETNINFGKNKTKTFFSGLFKTCFCIGFVCFLIFSPSVVFDQSNYRLNLNQIYESGNAPKCVLTLHHIETFEGGSFSREKYLQKQANKFNLQNKNCFIVIKTLTLDDLILNLADNNKADIYSFSCGAGEILAGFLKELKNNDNVRDDLVQYGKCVGKLLAYPYILSGYALFSYDNLADESDTLDDLVKSKKIGKKEYAGLSLSDTTLGQEVLKINNVEIDSKNIMSFSSSYEAYQNFLKKNSISLLGTARDLARLKNREEKGAISSLRYNFLGEFSDLVQYVGVAESGSSIKEYYAEQFVQFLTTDACQNDLANYGLFSTNGKNIYSSGEYLEFENKLKSNLKSKNVFEKYKK